MQVTSTSVSGGPTACRFCGHFHGIICPSVKSVEYYPDGNIKCVVYLTAADYPQPRTAKDFGVQDVGW